jgi:hypothetical protein
MFSIFKSKQPAGILVTPDKLFSAIRRDHGHLFSESCKIRLADATYFTVTEDQARNFIFKSKSFYRPQVNDCDDQAFAAKYEAIKAQQSLTSPLAFGILWTEDHALNWYMDYGFKIRLIDQEQHSGVLTPATLWLA